MRRRLTEADVLTFRLDRHSQDTVRRHYLNWRRRHGMSIRCDNVHCRFHTGKLKWNGQELKLILDHIDGCRYHNRPENLRLLCPACDSQLPTRGGANKRRVQNLREDGFQIGRNVTVFLRGLRMETSLGELAPTVAPPASPS
jgi:hypothetical protein